MLSTVESDFLLPKLSSWKGVPGILRTLSQIGLPGAWIFLDVDTQSRFVTTVY